MNAINPDILKNFLTNTDETGRFVVTSQRTGKTYYVEPIAGSKVAWGDMDPATKKLSGSYGKKYTGAVEKSESVVKLENGFSKVHELEPGVSPLHAIDVIDAQYPDKQ